jgi:hypothetical protein
MQTPRDWKAYEANAVMRGNLMLYISPDVANSWYVTYDKNSNRLKGGQTVYTDKCIQDVMALKYLLGFGYRQLEGFIAGLLKLAGLSHLPTPDRTTINTRAKSLKVRLPAKPNTAAGAVISLDSTGLKIHGQGEWNRKKHKQRDRARWVKMHIAIDNNSMQILDCVATADDVHDCEVFDEIIDSLNGVPSKVLGDGAYDTIDAYKKSIEVGFQLVALPRENAVVNDTSTKPHIHARNQQVQYYQDKGMHAWANKNDYWQRNKVETTMSRFVTAFSDRLSSRTVETQKNEIAIKCHLLNIMASNNNLQDSAA